MQMAIYMKETGWMTKHVELVFISIRMGPYFKGSGLMINRMGMAKKNGLMGQNMKDNIVIVLNKAMGS